MNKQAKIGMILFLSGIAFVFTVALLCIPHTVSMWNTLPKCESFDTIMDYYWSFNDGAIKAAFALAEVPVLFGVYMWIVNIPVKRKKEVQK